MDIYYLQKCQKILKELVLCFPNPASEVIDEIHSGKTNIAIENGPFEDVLVFPKKKMVIFHC